MLAKMSRQKVVILNSKKTLDKIANRILERSENGGMSKRDFYLVWDVIIDRELGAVRKRIRKQRVCDIAQPNAQ